MDNCVFCGIVKGEISAVKIKESEDFLAILDVSPNTPGMTVVLSKRHYDSYLENMPDGVKGNFFVFAKEVCRYLDKGLGTKRTAIVLEGLGVNHAHLKLYPMHSLENVLREIQDGQVYYEKYPGFVDTRHGPKATEENLNKIASKLLAQE